MGDAFGIDASKTSGSHRISPCFKGKSTLTYVKANFVKIVILSLHSLGW